MDLPPILNKKPDNHTHQLGFSCIKLVISFLALLGRLRVRHENLKPTPKQELGVSSHKIVDGRGTRVVVGEGGTCFTLRNGSNVIIHSFAIHNYGLARKATSRR
jgi:hypothetical protein